MQLDDCLQEQCAHCPLNQHIKGEPLRTQMLMMCPICRRCGAPKHKINPDCSECVACENIPNRLRGDLPDGWQDATESESSKQETPVLIT